jgi:hypothetical protein
VRILAHSEVSKKGDRLSNRRQVIERRHRRLNLITDTLHFDQQAWWLFFAQYTP